MSINFINKNGRIKWRIRRGIKMETVNATIDDLRIVKSLILADQKWNRPDYNKFAKQLLDRMLLYCISQERLKAYDSENSREAPLVYYDFEVMNMMIKYNVINGSIS